MNRLFNFSLLIIVLIALARFTTAQEKVDVSGTWEFTIESPQGASTATATFKVDGEKVTGVIKGRRGELPISGTIKGKEIKLAYTIKFQDNDLAINLSGTAEKDSMKGTADFGGFAEGSWTAKRSQGEAASTASSSSAADKIDISGKWIFTVETEQGSGSPEFTFKQEGEKLTGSYKGLFGEAQLQGTVKGKEINFSFKVSAQGMEGVMIYSGTIEKDSMKGTVKLGDLGSGTWTARRQ